ncbi:PAAR domain-containing protein [Cupriavidus sp. IDO]|uniref:PAAR domain-containing protein n=1 Tax=Cupriavidus sp. IDO TaxID=1539142 RepID=UPI0005795426|nr:PAAR domain-containing protein [Cupriavidus sp. IDO]
MLTRTYLIMGDKANNGATIIGGSPSSTYEGIPTAREGDPVYCPVCKQTGAIVCVGPRWPSSENGKEEALSGDICACGCNPPPVFHASRPYTMTMTAGDAAQWNRSHASSGGNSSAMSGYDEQVRVRTGDVLIEGYPYFIETSDGRTFSGHLDESGRLPRVSTESSDNYVVYWGDEALAKQDEV